MGALHSAIKLAASRQRLLELKSQRGEMEAGRGERLARYSAAEKAAMVERLQGEAKKFKLSTGNFKIGQ